MRISTNMIFQKEIADMETQTYQKPKFESGTQTYQKPKSILEASQQTEPIPTKIKPKPTVSKTEEMKYNPEEELKQQGLKRMEVEPFSETGTHTIQHEQTKKISIEKPVIVPKPTPEQVVKKPPVNIMQMLREKNLGGPTEDESAEFLRQQAEAHAGVRGLEPVKEEEKGPTRRSSFAETQAGTEMPFGEEEVKTRAEEIPDEKSIQNQKNYVKTLNDELKNMRHGENKTILPGKGTTSITKDT